MPASLREVVPRGVRVLPLRGGPVEQRRPAVARVPGELPSAAARVVGALRAAAIEGSGAPRLPS